MGEGGSNRLARISINNNNSQEQGEETYVWMSPVVRGEPVWWGTSRNKMLWRKARQSLSVERNRVEE